eukprot:TRINITY_DN96466_c0_g1_i4.p1 TRINITY_DN96466_c0_g1~~TRINITY_DN96466_c0_g1_i4.p1  ORF type:complete len:180 (-),score=25.84 TRINITY_DN96466_c0_g1_i4:10-549(-)
MGLARRPSKDNIPPSSLATPTGGPGSRRGSGSGPSGMASGISTSISSTTSTSTTGTSSTTSSSTQKSTKTSVFDRLADPTTFTGTHREIFKDKSNLPHPHTVKTRMKPPKPVVTETKTTTTTSTVPSSSSVTAPPTTPAALASPVTKKSRESYLKKPIWEIGRAVQQECRDRSRMPSSA